MGDSKTSNGVRVQVDGSVLGGFRIHFCREIDSHLDDQAADIVTEKEDGPYASTLVTV